MPPALPMSSQEMVPNPIYEGEEDYETIDDCQKDYRDAQLTQLSTVDGVKGNNLSDGEQPLPFQRKPSDPPPANILMDNYGSGTELKPQYLVDPHYSSAASPAGAQSTTAIRDDLHDPNGDVKRSDFELGHNA